MRRPEQIRVIKTLMDRIDRDVNVDAGGILHAPVSTYTCPDRAAKEWQTFFKEHPQMIGLSGDLPESGSFFTMNDFGLPILATRDQAGKFRAFANVCRHRGAIVEREARGKKHKFTCEFHAWTYSNEGDLVALPKQEHFGAIDKACHGLVELPAVEQYGLLFVHPKVDVELNIDELLGGLSDELDAYGFSQFVQTGDDTYEHAMNWKLAIDTFGETYHFGSLHKNTLFPLFHGNVQCYDTYGRNHRMSLCQRGIDPMRELPESEWTLHDAVFPVYYLFPNVQVNVGAGGVTLVRVYPDGDNPHHSRSKISFYHHPDVLAVDPEAATYAARTFGEIIRDEDYAAAARTHQGACSGAIDHFVFGRNEPPLHHYHQTYREALGMEPLPLIKA
jgi:nitrite reductase/ring-hydroxylating ferredoxin subunit